jgi:hypothetical protein
MTYQMLKTTRGWLFISLARPISPLEALLVRATKLVMHDRSRYSPKQQDHRSSRLVWGLPANGYRKVSTPWPAARNADTAEQLDRTNRHSVGDVSGLIELASHPSEVANKKVLLAQVWPEVTVEEGSLRLHIVSLRNALCGGKHGAIATRKGRSCCLAASDWVEEIAAAVRFPNANLPAGLVGMFGRERGRRV